MTAPEGMDQFPEPAPTPRMYRLTTPDHRDDTGREWMASGLCTQTDPELFSPEKGGSVKEAKKICADFAGRAQCLQWAPDHNEQRGVWGGMSPMQRARLRNRRTA